MKKLDKLVLKSFIGPFVLTFFITLFILVMQFLWKYVDDMIGKGLEWYLILELLFYSSASMVPLALPLSVLLSSIMTFGSLGEHFELSAFKASGISLFRVMWSMIVAVIVISMGAFFFSNYALPYANLKFGSLLYDIREQKPAFNIREGVFYNGIEGYTIRVNKKDSDNKTIHDILIYDHTNGRGNDDVIIAKDGKMFTTEDKRYLILRLFDGAQYQEVKPMPKKRRAYEQVRIKFKEFEKILDLSEFALFRTDESYFKDHYAMMNVGQLSKAIDSLKNDLSGKKKTLQRYIKPVFYFKKHNLDSLLEITNTGSLAAATDLSLTNHKYSVQKAVYKRALNAARNVKGFSSIVKRDIEIQQKNLVKHKVEWHRKFTLSIACLVLFFIGAPLGAIIRLGGLGMPLVVAVVFFLVFHVTSIMGEKSAKEFVLSAFSGMWLATMILLPIGIFLTYKAMNDSTLFNVHWYAEVLTRIFSFKKKGDG